MSRVLPIDNTQAGLSCKHTLWQGFYVAFMHDHPILQKTFATNSKAFATGSKVFYERVLFICALILGSGYLAAKSIFIYHKDYEKTCLRFLFVLALLLCQFASAQVSLGGIALTTVTIIDANHRGPLVLQTVLIEGGVIKDVFADGIAKKDTKEILIALAILIYAIVSLIMDSRKKEKLINKNDKEYRNSL